MNVAHIDFTPALTSPPNARTILAEFKGAHACLLARMDELDAITRTLTPEADAYVSARWRLSQASLVRRKLWARTYHSLRSTLGGKDVVDLEALQSADQQMRRESAAHVGRWPTGRISSEWQIYCEASRVIRSHMKKCISAERRLLYPILERRAQTGT